MNSYFIATLNSVSSTVVILSLIVYVLFTLSNIKHARKAFIIMIIAAIIATITPNKAERIEFFGAKDTESCEDK